jgi:hypothetical protein
LLASLARILRPLVRLMIANGITLPSVVEMLKDTYVKVAAEDFRIGEAPPPDTRISLLTGVHRKDVKRLRESAHARGADVAALNVLSEVVTRWISDRRYVGRDGKPRALPRTARAGVTHSFASLAYGISSDLKPRPILDELKRLDMVSVDDDDRIALKVEAFVPGRSGEEKAFFFGENAGDHVAAGVHNLLGEAPAFLDQAVYSDDLSPDSVNTLLHLSREQWSEVLKTLVRRTAELEAIDKAAGRATERLNVGMYFYSEPRAAPPERET